MEVKEQPIGRSYMKMIDGCRRKQEAFLRLVVTTYGGGAFGRNK